MYNVYILFVMMISEKKTSRDNEVESERQERKRRRRKRYRSNTKFSTLEGLKLGFKELDILKCIRVHTPGNTLSYYIP